MFHGMTPEAILQRTRPVRRFQRVFVGWVLAAALLITIAGVGLVPATQGISAPRAFLRHPAT